MFWNFFSTYPKHILRSNTKPQNSQKIHEAGYFHLKAHLQGLYVQNVNFRFGGCCFGKS
jgi:hypothetical protein